MITIRVPTVLTAKVTALASTAVVAVHPRSVAGVSAQPAPAVKLGASPASPVVLARVGSVTVIGQPAAVEYVADEPLSALRAVRMSGERIVYARFPELESKAPVGITTHSVMAGETATLAAWGELQDSSWSWVVGQPVLLGALGTLTQTPADPFVVQLGIAVAADTIVVRIESPITLA
jgi:hypothetical protein